MFISNAMNLKARIIKYQKTIRSNEWWYYKINIFFAFGLWVLLLQNQTIQLHTWLNLLVILLGLVIGAVFVSLINDFFDYERDLVSNKKNAITLLGKKKSLALIILCILLGVVYAFFLISNPIQRILYASMWVVFYMYSAPPFRLKNSGFWGTLADASGAQTLPVLFTIIMMSNQTIHLWLMCAILINQLTFGLRSIFSHQCQDYNNDIKSGEITFATKYGINKIEMISKGLFMVELCSLALILFSTHKPLLFLSVFFYGIYLLGVKYIMKFEWVVVSASVQQPRVFLMSEFYLFYFPVFLWLILILQNPFFLLGLILFLALFHQQTQWQVHRLSYISKHIAKTMHKFFLQ